MTGEPLDRGVGERGEGIDLNGFGVLVWGLNGG